MKNFLTIIALLCFSACSNSNKPGEASSTSLLGLSEIEKLQVIDASISGSFNTKKVYPKDICLLKYMDVSGTKSGDTLEATIKYDAAALTIMMLTGAKTHDKAYCESLDKEMAKLAAKDHKMETITEKINMTTGKKIKK